MEYGSRIPCWGRFSLTNLFVQIDVFFSSKIKGRTPRFSTKKSAVRVVP